MTGVVAALGGRAAQTSRGQSLKNFIKKGCRYVSIGVRFVAEPCIRVNIKNEVI